MLEARIRGRERLLAVALLVVAGAAACRGGTPADATAPPAPAGATRPITVVSLSDIHFDPFYDPALFAELMAAEAPEWARVFAASTVHALAPAGHDSNYDLLASALGAARDAVPEPDYLVISGDFLAHGFQDSFRTALAALPSGAPPAGDCRSSGRPPLECFVDRTIEFVALMLRDSFATAPIYAELGNNDSYCGDYEIDPVGPFVARTGATWSRLLVDPGNRAAFDATFADGGYYAVTPAAGGGRIVALNTNIFSTRYRDACALADARERAPLRSGAAGAPAPEAAAAQLAWLEEQLQEAEQAGEGVWLLFHIPAGTDVYATLKHGDATRVDGVMSYWDGPHTSAFLDIVGRHAGAVRGMLAGHTHMDQYLLVSRGGAEATTFEHITPAISPIFGNNPAFEVLTLDAGGTLSDYVTWYLPVAGAGVEAGASAGAEAGATSSWRQEYRFSEAYGAPAVTAPALAALWSRLRQAGDARSRWQRYYPAGNGAAATFDATTWPAYWCGIGTVTAADFVGCGQRVGR